mmetsp:Transcript_38003/g.61751  ORF Transcript_38003/g.61751 Transcript_38003/m.61751 type:complete len:130 (+) Transcript_38003:22-411(+)
MFLIKNPGKQRQRRSRSERIIIGKTDSKNCFPENCKKGGRHKGYCRHLAIKGALCWVSLSVLFLSLLCCHSPFPYEEDDSIAASSRTNKMLHKIHALLRHHHHHHHHYHRITIIVTIDYHLLWLLHVVS